MVPNPPWFPGVFDMVAWDLRHMTCDRSGSVEIVTKTLGSNTSLFVSTGFSSILGKSSSDDVLNHGSEWDTHGYIIFCGQNHIRQPPCWSFTSHWIDQRERMPWGTCVCFRSVQFDEPKHLKHLSTWEAWDGCDFILCLCYYK